MMRNYSIKVKLEEQGEFGPRLVEEGTLFEFKFDEEGSPEERVEALKAIMKMGLNRALIAGSEALTPIHQALGRLPGVQADEEEVFLD